jgi:hypothetical protein
MMRRKRNGWWAAALGLAAAAVLGPAALAGGCTSDSYVWVCRDDAGRPYGADGPCDDAGPDAAACDDAGPDAAACGDAGPSADAPEPRGAGGGGGTAGGGGTGGGGGMSSLCGGQCVPKEPVGWSDPALLWIGPPEQAPDCPSTAPTLGFEGYADLLVEPSRCAECACDAPEVSCELPVAWAARAGPSCDPAATTTSFAAPDGWDGTCATANAIPAGQACGGGPCTQSLDIPAPRVLASACAPRTVEPALGHFGESRWATVAKACVGTAFPECVDPAMTCVPAQPEGEGAPEEEFLTCIAREGEQSCPATYPSRHVFHGEAEDTRSCAPCACGEPAGATCSVMASAFSDGACSRFVAGVLVRSDDPLCLEVAAGTALGSKSASVVDIEPGSCTPSGGELSGGVAPRDATTFCCRDGAT